MPKSSIQTVRGWAIAVSLLALIAAVPGSPDARTEPSSARSCPEPELRPDPITGELTPLCELLDSYGLADPDLIKPYARKE